MKRQFCRMLSVILVGAMSLSLLSVSALADEIIPVDIIQSVLSETKALEENTDEAADTAAEVDTEETLSATAGETAETLLASYPPAYPLPELTGDQATDIMNIARSQLGYAWDGGTEYCAWWSDVTGYDYTASQGWCSVFACWCAMKAGVGMGKAYNYNGGSPTLLLEWYMKNAYVDLEHTTEPQPGDFVFIGYSTSRVTHVALVESYDPETEMITYIGGNQSGGKVSRLTISWDPDYVSTSGKKMLCYGRPNYDTSYTVSFDANGGECGKKNMIVAPQTAIGELPVPSRAGYTFEGWYTSATGGSPVTETTVVAGNMTVYAQWKAVSCSITPSAENITIDLRAGTTGELSFAFSGNLPEDHTMDVTLTADNITTAWTSRKTESAVLKLTALSAGYCDLIVSYTDSATGTALDTVVVHVVVIGNSGGCGEDLVWNAANDGVLTIEGDGPMWDFYVGWPDYYALGSEITSVEIIGAETVGAYGFYDLQALREVHLSASVVSVGDCAFLGCSSLTDVYFGGTPDQWELLKETAGKGNEALFAAVVHYTGEAAGIINAYDLVQLMKHIAGLDVVLDEAVRDPNGDTVTDILDVIRLTRYLAGEDVTLN